MKNVENLCFRDLTVYTNERTEYQAVTLVTYLAGFYPFPKTFTVRIPFQAVI